MAVEESLYEVRLAKANAWRALGRNPFANDFRPSATAADVHAVCGVLDAATLEKEGELPAPQQRYRYAIAGRAVTWRSFGKATFFHLQDRTGRVQVYVKKDLVGDEAYAQFKEHVEVGDVLGVEGRAFRTKTDELTLEVTSVRLLTKALRQLPEKWHGLTDKETRYRQRWLDLITNAEVRAAFERRSQIIRHVRRFLDGRGFMEVETPMMHPIKGGATARPFLTHHNALGMDLFMRVAPELYLKRLVTGGFERVYEINRNFRNEGLSAHHNPEFTMLEFYQAYATYEDLMDLTEEMFTELVGTVNAGSTQIIYQGTPISFARPWRRVTMEDAVRALVPETDALLANPEQGVAYLRALGSPWATTPNRGQILLDLFEKKVEATLVDPTFITDFPAEVSPLARRKDADPSLVDRFELFIAGMEVANAFSELNNPVDQEGRFRQQAAAGAAGDAEAMEYDANYILCLEYGMPPAAGEGVGIDRLCMLLTDQPSIRDVILFPLLRKESGT